MSPEVASGLTTIRLVTCSDVGTSPPLSAVQVIAPVEESVHPTAQPRNPQMSIVSPILPQDLAFDAWQHTFLTRLNRRFESAPAEDILTWAITDFGTGLSIGTTFGASGMALMDIALRIDPDVDIFYVDTGYFFPETLDLIRRAQERYGRSFRRVRSSGK